MLPKGNVQKLIEESKREAEKKALTNNKSQISFEKIKSKFRKILGEKEK